MQKCRVTLDAAAAVVGSDAQMSGSNGKDDAEATEAAEQQQRKIHANVIMLLLLDASLEGF